jgi:adenine-specific DNA-methyltransferase
MQNLQNDLIDLLKHEDNLVVEGHLNKNKIIELALKVEPQLIILLLKNETFKKHFFQEVENVLVFDKIKFQRFVNNKSFLPDSYTAFKNKIGLTVNDNTTDNFITSSNDVVLAWPHKDCVLEGGQTKEDQKRNEIFWNETLAPDSVDRLLDAKALTNFKLFDKDGEHEITELKGNENLIIKGNNLLALASLLKTHRGRIKLIYIDPPYNTGSDSFGYNDNFNHSTWLTFMKNRLEIARKLLSPNGFICCHIDDSEGQYLKILLDEIFGRENFQTVFNIKVRYADKTLKQDMSYHKEIENVFIYGKSNLSKPNLNVIDNSIDKYIYYIDELEEGTETILGDKKVIVFDKSQYKINKKVASADGRKEIWASGTILDGNSSGRFFRDYLTGRFEFDGYGVLYKVYDVGDEKNNFRYFTGPQKVGATKGKYFQGVPASQVEGGQSTLPINSYYDMAGYFGNCRNEGAVELRSGKKPEQLLKVIIEHFSNENDFVMDYHLGSGSTAATALKMNRRFIGCEQLDYGNNDSVKRLINVINGDKTGVSNDVNWQGGGSFVYTELLQYNQKYVALIQDSVSKDELINVWNEMQDTAFLSYQFDKKTFNERLDAFKTAPLEDMKQYLFDVLDKNQLYVNYSEINDRTFNVSEEDKALNKQFYSKK